MIPIKTRHEIALIKESSLLVGKTLAAVAAEIRPGISTKLLDTLAETFIKDHGATPSFKGYRGFPFSLCISVNEVVVHGMPSEYLIREGDLVSVDCGVFKNGFHGDSAFSFLVDGAGTEAGRLCRVTRECLTRAIEMASAGNRVGDISYAVQSHAEQHGYGVVRELVGHGVGRNLHEKPEVPNYGKKGQGPVLKEGMVLAIEPMINMGERQVVQERDGWTIRTRDCKPSAHFEHTVAITSEGPMVLSSFEDIETAIQNNKHIKQKD
jgi:methionyl aminopeptidase